MAVRIATTHIWTKVFIPVVFISRILLLIVVFSLGFLAGIKLPDNWVGVAIGIVTFFGTIILHAVVIEQFYHELQTYLYIKINLGVDISFKETKHFILLFVPSDLGKWYPMTGIKDLPKNDRKRALFDSAKSIYTQLGYEVKFNDSYKFDGNTSRRVDSEFFLPGFADLVAILYKLSKADQVVSKEEIQIIDDFFTNVVKLTPEEKREAINIFNNAKMSTVPFEAYARRFYGFHEGKNDLLEGVIVLLTQIAFADGELSAEEEILINEAIAIFGVGKEAYEKIKRSQNISGFQNSDKFQHYVNILGISGEITLEKVKAAYRKLVMQYHPERLSHLGDEMMEIGEEKMKLINEAHDYLQSVIK